MVLNKPKFKALFNVTVFFGCILLSHSCVGNDVKTVLLTSIESPNFEELKNVAARIGKDNKEIKVIVTDIIPEWKSDSRNSAEQFFNPASLSDAAVVVFDTQLSCLARPQLDAIVRLVEGKSTLIGIGRSLTSISLLEPVAALQRPRTTSYDFASSGFGVKAIVSIETTNCLRIDAEILKAYVGVGETALPSTVALPDPIHLYAEIRSDAKSLIRSCTGRPVLWSYRRASGGMSFFISIDSDANLATEPFSSIIDNLIKRGSLQSR